MSETKHTTAPWLMRWLRDDDARPGRDFLAQTDGTRRGEHATASRELKEEAFPLPEETEQ
jgi:hypothetical protein